jgi:prepilin-type processing-associated H-X9-DG protein
MYGVEAKAGVYPHLQVANYFSNEVAIAVGPQTTSIYPEYLTDPAIAVCPSDSKTTVDDFKNDQGDYILHEKPNLIDDSYIYIGWAFDKVNEPSLPVNTFTILPLLFTALDVTLPNTQVLVPAQVSYLLEGLIGVIQNIPANVLTAFDDPAIMAVVADQDVPTGAIHPITLVNMGNGGGDTIFRLREGVERFMITDINNPAASSMAQSELWIMFDLIGAYGATSEFNHIPGGSNCLYMDGHVSFIRYTVGQPDTLGNYPDTNSTPPVTPSMALIVAALTGNL